MAEAFAKVAASGASDSVDRQLLRQASLSHLARVTTEIRAKVQGTGSRAASARTYEERERRRLAATSSFSPATR